MAPIHDSIDNPQAAIVAQMKKRREPIDDLIDAFCEMRKRERRDKRREQHQQRSAGPARARDASTATL